MLKVLNKFMMLAMIIVLSSCRDSYTDLNEEWFEQLDNRVTVLQDFSDDRISQEEAVSRLKEIKKRIARLSKRMEELDAKRVENKGEGYDFSDEDTDRFWKLAMKRTDLVIKLRSTGKWTPELDEAHLDD